jgi:hypothetical protein
MKVEVELTELLEKAGEFEELERRNKQLKMKHKKAAKMISELKHQNKRIVLDFCEMKLLELERMRVNIPKFVKILFI